MENFNDLVNSEMISQFRLESSDSCCYRRGKNSCLKCADDFFENIRNSSFNGDTVEQKANVPNSSLNLTNSNFNILNSSQNNFVDNDGDKLKVLLTYEDAPKHLQFNPYIRRGYRAILPTKMCLQSMFWWTNETVNIWSHLVGWFVFVALTVSDLQFLTKHATFEDKIIVGSLLVCFQICMLLSSIYHIFSCRSEKDYDSLLTYDLFGISLSILAIYISGIYYAFWCHEKLRNFYTLTIIGMFAAAIIIQIPRLNVDSNTKMYAFVAWAAYGFIPAFHWIIEMGGFQNPVVKLLVPRVVIMYLLVGIAFLIYIMKIPERWFTGKVDFCGHSHNWWHLFVLVALYYWHNTGVVYAEFRLNNRCEYTSAMYS